MPPENTAAEAIGVIRPGEERPLTDGRSPSVAGDIPPGEIGERGRTPELGRIPGTYRSIRDGR